MSDYEKQPHEHSVSQLEHRHVLPQGKPRGVATENGKSFEEAGIEGSNYKDHEYDLEPTVEATKRNASLSTSSGSSAESSGGGGGLLGKVVRLIPLSLCASFIC